MLTPWIDRVFDLFLCMILGPGTSQIPSRNIQMQPLNYDVYVQLCMCAVNASVSCEIIRHLPIMDTTANDIQSKVQQFNSVLNDSCSLHHHENYEPQLASRF